MKFRLEPPMGPVIRYLGVLGLAGVAPSALGAAVTDVGFMEDGIRPLSSEHTFYESVDGDARLKAGLSLYWFGAVTDDVNFGSDRSIDGIAPTHEDPAWWEAVAQPELIGELDVGNGGGTLFSGLQGSLGMTRGSRYGDAAGATPGHPEGTRLDRAYVGWRSGQLFADSLGKDAVTLSLGRQKFLIGDGFLLGDGFSDFGRNATYYIGPSESFEKTAVASIDSHGWHGDVFHLEEDQTGDGTDVETKVNGTNVNYRLGKRAKFGAAYLHTYDSDIATREGLDVYNLRAKGVPLTGVPHLSLGGQWVHQDNEAQGIDDDGWYLQATYTFENAPWRPQVLYRRAEFSEGYDPLFFDFVGGWGNWFMGEIVGEYMLFNSNLDIDMLKATVKPNDDLTTGAIAYRFRYHDSDAAPGSGRDFAKEINLFADWALTKKLSVSTVYAIAFPDEGADDRFMGNDDTSQLFEIYAYYRF